MNDRKRVDNWLDGLDQRGDPSSILRLIGAEIKRLRAELGNILAIIHRDGGLHTEEVGERQ